MKNPFLDAMAAPMAMTSATKFMRLLQEQQMDTVETSVRALSCRDPMQLVTLHQAFLQRMVGRWTAAAAAAKDSAKGAAKDTKAAVQKAEAVLKEAKTAATPPPPAAPKLAQATPKVVPAPVKPPAPKLAAANDDLTVIKGIGPKFAKTLNEHGITSYRQLASLKPKEVEALEAKLGFSGRFEREGWIEQARELAH